MKTLYLGLFIFTFKFISICTATECIQQNEFTEFDSLFVLGKVNEIKNYLALKKQADFDTNYYRYKQRHLENELIKIDSLRMIIEQSELLNQIVQYRTLKIFINKRDKFSTDNSDSTMEKQYKTCFEKKSLICLYIVRYLNHRNRIIEKRKSQISSKDEIHQHVKYTDEIKKYDLFLYDGNIDTVLIIMKANLTLIHSKFEQHYIKIDCLNRETKMYSQIIQTLEEFENSDDISKQRSIERLKTKKEMFSIENAGKDANKFYNIFFESGKNNKQALIYYLFARKKKIEFVNMRRAEIRENHGIAKQLYKLKKYDEAQGLVLHCKNDITDLPSFKIIYDSLCFLSDQLDKSIEVARYKQSLWTSAEQVIKSYQFFLGMGVSYNPSLMNFHWKLNSLDNNEQLFIPVYKLRDTFSTNFSAELSMYLYSNFIIGVKTELMKVKYSKVVLSISQDITTQSSYTEESSINYQIDCFAAGLFGKYYFKTSPGLMPYAKLSLGTININRDPGQITKTEMIYLPPQPRFYVHYYLTKKNIQEFQIIPEIGIDFLKSTNSFLVYTVYLHTILMTGGINEMLGHVRVEAGFRIGLLW